MEQSSKNFKLDLNGIYWMISSQHFWLFLASLNVVAENNNNNNVSVFFMSLQLGQLVVGKLRNGPI